MTDEPARGDWPEWVTEAERRGTDPSRFADTPGGSARAALWKAIGPVTDAEFSWAMQKAPPLESLPASMYAVARVTALREARHRFRHLSQRTWEQLVHDLAPRLLAQAMTDADAIAAAVEQRTAATVELAAGAADDLSARGFTKRQIKRAAAEVRANRDGHPTRAEVAEALHTTESTLYRAMRDLGMSGWPPAQED